MQFISHLVGDSHRVRTERTVERLMVFDLLLLLYAKYSSKENSQVVASKERWPGDLLPEILPSFLEHYADRRVSQSVDRG